jgi:hypothetical protein
MIDTTLRLKLIRLAHTKPELRSHLLPLLNNRPVEQVARHLESPRQSQDKNAKVFNTDEALQKYLKEHPDADKSKHSIKTKEEKPSKEKSEKKPEGKSEKKPETKTPDVSKIPADATIKDLPPQAREEIADYKISVVGDSAKQALEISRKLKKGIDKAADICKMSPSVCRENKGLTRDKMPQIEGEKSIKAMLASSDPKDVAKGKAMVEAGADPKSDKTVMQQMVAHLSDNGVKTTKKTMPVGKMKATQSEIKAAKVFGMADAHLKGKFDNIDDSVIVSKDGHILDGHHRWAALLTIDPSREMKVQEIDMTMDELLKEAASVPGVYKADFEGNPLPEKDQKKYKEEHKSTFKKSSAALYRSVVRLAHSNPELRSVLLPLLKKGSAMKLLFSKVEDIDGDFSVDAGSGEALGHIQLYGLTLMYQSNEVLISIAGTLLIDRLKRAPFPQSMEGTVLSIDDINLILTSRSPKKILVSGMVSLQSEEDKSTTTNFVGTFHPTGYLQQAWKAIQDPNWDGSQQIF